MAIDPALVVIFLRGGADGLNLVCPASDDNLIAARPEDLRVLRNGDAAGRVIAQDIADVDFRFHPQAADLADLYDAGDLSLVHASGLIEATRSHFDAEARIEWANDLMAEYGNGDRLVLTEDEDGEPVVEIADAEDEEKKGLRFWSTKSVHV